MRLVLGLPLALTIAMSGGNCIFPLELGTQNTVEPTVTLAVSVSRPSVDLTVPIGDAVDIEWAVANLTTNEAVASLFVRSRADFSETLLAGGIRVSETGSIQTAQWDTSGFERGEYSIVVRAEAGNLVAEESAAGRVMLNQSPSFEFGAPVRPFTLKSDLQEGEPDQGPTVTLRWVSSDPDGDGHVVVGVDRDDDHESGNEIIVVDQAIPQVEEFETGDWDGTDEGTAVSPGEFNYYAIVTDSVNEQQIFEGLATINVEAPDEPEPVVTLAITEPAEDTTFLDEDDPLSIQYTLDEADDVLVDIKVDPDDNHQNGNEITIDAQRLVEAGTTEVTDFEWDGTDSKGAKVGDGIYRPFLVVNRGDDSPEIKASDHLIFLRDTEFQALIAILSPNVDQTVDSGAIVTIRWRDDAPKDPNDPNQADALVSLSLDDDESPNQAVEGDDPEISILTDRDAAGDGVQDSFVYQVPDTLGPGRYYIFAYIKRDGTIEHISIGAGQIVIEDPNAP